LWRCERKRNALDMKSRIRFHSIFYRYIFSIILFSGLVFYVSSGSGALEIRLWSDKLIIGWEELTYIIIAAFALVAVFSFLNWKFYISKEGFYLRKIDLSIPWDDVVAVNHVWINEWSHARPGNYFLYNRRTLVIYREKYKPVCIYNISLWALYVAKCYHPTIKTNLVSATLATVFSLTLSGWILYELWFNHLRNVTLTTLFVWAVLYALKWLLPLVMVKYQNKRYGDYLFHDTIYKKNASNAIHV